MYLIKKFLRHVCGVKLFGESYFCFPLTGNNAITLIFLFDKSPFVYISMFLCQVKKRRAVERKPCYMTAQCK